MNASEAHLTSDQKNYRDEYPELGTSPVPIEPYFSEDYLAQECAHIFSKMWLMVGRTDRLKNIGDYFVKEIECLNKSIIVVKGKDRQVRAFYNVCRHRGTNIASGAGNCKYFTCRFHGWVYDTDGSIAHVPEENQFYELDKDNINLQSIRCEIWKGFVFVNFSENPRETLREQLAEYWDRFADFPFEEMPAAGRWGATLKANWKLFQDAFQEGYHVATVHAGTIGEYFTGKRNPNCRPYYLGLFKRNRSMSFSYNPEFTPHPSEVFAVRAGASLSSQGKAATTRLSGTNPGNDPHYSFDVNAVFPNWLCDTSAGFFFIHEFWPIDAVTTRWEATLHFLPTNSPTELISQMQSVTLLRDAFREDIATSEGSQAGLMSGSLKEINFSDVEIPCRHQYQVIQDLIDNPL